MQRKRIFHRVLAIEKQLINGLLCLLLTAMILLACLQIVLRTFFSGGLLWIDPLVRYLVLWCGMLGAVVATREKKHISIDVAAYLAPQWLTPWIALIIDFFSFVVAGLLTWAAIIFIRFEVLFASTGLLSLPSWFWNLIFPVAFALIAIHFLLAAVDDIKRLSNIPPQADNTEGTA